MARIPQYVAGERINTGAGTIPDTRPDTSVARGLISLGNSLEVYAARAQQQENERQKFAAQAQEFDLMSERDQALRERQQNMEPGAAGFAKGAIEDFDKRSSEFIAKLPENIRPQFEARMRGFRGRYLDQAATIEDGERKRWFVSETGRMNDARLNRVYDNPTAWEAERAEGEATIDATGLAPAQKEELKAQWREKVDVARARRDVDSDPLGALNRLGAPGGLVGGAKLPPEASTAIDAAAVAYGVKADDLKVIAWLESKGDSKAKNPSSSAGGLFQFIDGTARQYGLKDRYDPVQASEAAAALMQSNKAVLRSVLGREATVGELYLAHQQGAGGASKLLRSPTALAKDVVGLEAVRLNLPANHRGRANDMTAQEFANLWIKKAEAVAGGAPSPSAVGQSVYENLPLDTRLKLIHDARIAEGKVLEAQAAQQRFASIMTGDANFNPYNKDDRKLVDDAFDAGGARDRVRGMDDSVLGDVARVSGSLGYVPKPVTEELLNMAQTGDPTAKTWALQTASAILATQPNAFDKSEGAGTLVEQARDFDALIRSGLTADKAVSRVAEMQMPEYRDRKKAVEGSKEFKDFLSARTAGEITDEFDGFWTREPRLGANDAEAALVVSDYRKLSEYHYLRTGETALAKQLALLDLKKSYGVSEVAGDRRVMRNPPESFYPAIDGSHEYIRRQLEADVRDVAGKDAEVTGMRLESTRETDEDVLAKRPPRYAVFFTRKDKDGQLVEETIPGFLFQADTKTEIGRVSIEREEEFVRLQDDQQGLELLQEERAVRRKMSARAARGDRAAFTEGQTKIQELRQRRADLKSAVPVPSLENLTANQPGFDPMGNVTGF